VHGRRAGAEGRELLGIGRRDGSRVELAEPLGEHRRAGEGPLHRELLIQEHRRQKRERVGVEQRVRLRIAADVEAHETILPDRSHHRGGTSPCSAPDLEPKPFHELAGAQVELGMARPVRSRSSPSVAFIACPHALRSRMSGSLNPSAICNHSGSSGSSPCRDQSGTLDAVVPHET
jgi:hypothetical protein